MISLALRASLLRVLARQTRAGITDQTLTQKLLLHLALWLRLIGVAGLLLLKCRSLAIRAKRHLLTLKPPNLCSKGIADTLAVFQVSLKTKAGKPLRQYSET